jgi:hypothetical protein
MSFQQKVRRLHLESRPMSRTLTAVLVVWSAFGITSIARDQDSAPSIGAPSASGLRKLTGDDARLAEELEKAIEAALKADRWQ